MAQSRFERKRKKRRSSWSIVLLSILFMFITGAGVFAWKIWSTAQNIDKNIYEPLDSSNETASESSQPVEVGSTAFNILLLGIENQGGANHADALILATVSPDTQQIYMTSIPRDSYVYIEKEKKEDKITHSYAYGGISATALAVEKMFDTKIDYYITTDFKGLQQMVDALDGITVNVPFTFKAEMTDNRGWHTYKKGTQELDGHEALAYARMRKSDPNGDFGRNERQKQVLKAIVDKASGIGVITKLDKIVSVVGDNTKTNIPSSEFLSFAQLYMKLKNAPIHNLHVDGKGTTINKVYYYIPSEESISSISQTMKSVLNDEIVTPPTDSASSSSNQ